MICPFQRRVAALAHIGRPGARKTLCAQAHIRRDTLDYAAAKRKCDAFTGEVKINCVNNAKARFELPRD